MIGQSCLCGLAACTTVILGISQEISPHYGSKETKGGSDSGDRKTMQYSIEIKKEIKNMS